MCVCTYGWQCLCAELWHYHLGVRQSSLQSVCDLLAIDWLADWFIPSFIHPFIHSFIHRCCGWVCRLNSWCRWSAILEVFPAFSWAMTTTTTMSRNSDIKLPGYCTASISGHSEYPGSNSSWWSNRLCRLWVLFHFSLHLCWTVFTNTHHINGHFQLNLGRPVDLLSLLVWWWIWWVWRLNSCVLLRVLSNGSGWF